MKPNFSISRDEAAEIQAIIEHYERKANGIKLKNQHLKIKHFPKTEQKPLLDRKAEILRDIL